MRTVFADAGYWVALLNPKDQLHTQAQNVSRSLGSVLIVTSEMALTEVMNGLASQGPQLRMAAVTLVERLQKDPNVTVVAQTSIQFNNAVAVYGERRDKTWGHTDCASFLIMNEKGITEALAHDKHFTQAGFKALLADEG